MGKKVGKMGTTNGHKRDKIVCHNFVTSKTKTPLKADKYDTFKGVT